MILSLVHKVVVFLLTLFLLVNLSFILVLFSPIYIFRKLVSLFAGRFCPQLGKILSTRSCISASFGIYEKSYTNVVVNITLTGSLDESALKKAYIVKIIEAKDKAGNLKYPEMQQFVHQWMGFSFWKWDREFNIDNHIRVMNNTMNDSKNDQSYVESLNQKLLSKPWTPSRSPWEFFIIQNFENGKTGSDQKETMVIMNFHHCLSDGFSVWKLTNKLGINKAVDKRLKHISSSAKKVSFGDVYQILKSPFDAIERLLRVSWNASDGRNSWGFDYSEFSREYITLSSDSLPLDILKEIKNTHNVTLTSVLLAAITAGIQKAYDTPSIQAKQLKLPKYMTVGGTVPMLGHPDKLRNHLSFALILLPVGEPSSKKRLEICNKEFEATKGSSGPVFLFYTLAVIGGLFNFMVKRLGKPTGGKVFMSNFPGAETFDILGHDGKSAIFMFGIPPCVGGIGFGIVSFKGEVKFTLSVDKTLMNSKEDVATMLRGAVEELNYLLKETT